MLVPDCLKTVIANSVSTGRGDVWVNHKNGLERFVETGDNNCVPLWCADINHEGAAMFEFPLDGFQTFLKAKFIVGESFLVPTVAETSGSFHNVAVERN